MQVQSAARTATLAQGRCQASCATSRAISRTPRGLDATADRRRRLRPAPAPGRRGFAARASVMGHDGDALSPAAPPEIVTRILNNLNAAWRAASERTPCLDIPRGALRGGAALRAAPLARWAEHAVQRLAECGALNNPRLLLLRLRWGAGRRRGLMGPAGMSRCAVALPCAPYCHAFTAWHSSPSPPRETAGSRAARRGAARRGAAHPSRGWPTEPSALPRTALVLHPS
jgi:hypothetical protein